MATAPMRPGEEVIPGYEVIEHLSRGRRLDVYDVWSAERGTRCVIKCIRPEREGETRARESLAREGELLMRLGHPHLVRAYEVHSEPRPAIVMETLSGETLAHLIAEERELSGVEIGHLIMHLGSAVGYLHRNGILHLDLKPSNVVADGGRAKVIDLSVARAPGVAPAGVGTPDFMAPEQARGGEVGPAADVWGVGIVVHEIITGERAFELDRSESETGASGSLTPSDTWEEDRSSAGESWDSGEPSDEEDYLQLVERAPRLSDRDDLPSDLTRLIDACLEPEPTDRPTVHALLARAEGLAEIPTELRRWG